jgi:filamentous hemagglutinin family protein
LKKLWQCDRFRELFKQRIYTSSFGPEFMKRSQAIVGLVLLGSIGCSQGAMAQVSADGTVGTIVSTGPLFTITGGTRPINGTNLFHSFKQFSLPAGSSAIFQNDSTVKTIFSRVTGGSVSDINGTIQTQGNASLFLMNPNGILFGPNAKLELGGSFVGTTASSIKFEDGIEFSSANLIANPLLSIKVPIGLQMGKNPGAIEVQGNGHQMKFSSTFALVSGAGQQTTGLQVSPNQTLALIGGDIRLTGGILSVPSGQIELGGVASGTVDIISNSKGFIMGYGGIRSFRDLTLTNASAIDASGSGDSHLQLVGRNISLNTGSIALIVNQSPRPGGSLTINASESFQLLGRSPGDIAFGSFLISDALMGSSANISISAPQIQLSDRGIVTARSFGQATGGRIEVSATNIQIDGELDNSVEIHSGFLPTALGQGNMGNLLLSTHTLSLINGGYINSSTLGKGNGSEVVINADSIRIDGINSLGQSSLIAAASFEKGNAGNLMINTQRISVTNGGTVSTATFDSGKAGNVIINATESAMITGRLVQNSFSSTDGVGSSADILPLSVRQLIGLPDAPSGDSGNVILTTSHLMIADGGAIKVNNQGSGNAGTIYINSEMALLKNHSLISAETKIKDGGNINLKTQKLLLRNQSSIIATTVGKGDGGNITIESPSIIGLENSDIIANAQQGRGGNIRINTQGIFGLQYRDRLTSENDITASSEFGINGNVQVNMLGINPTTGLDVLPIDVVDSSRQITDRCGAAKTSSFIATGRGGMPQNPMKKRGSDRSWHDLRPLIAKTPATTQPIIAENPIVEASAIQVDESGVIALVAKLSPTSVNPYMTCALGNGTSY